MLKQTLTLTLASSLLVGVTGLVASRANAQSTANVDFNGTVATFCDFNGSGTAGTLTDVGPVLSSANAGGTSGSVDITCNVDTATLEITNVTEGTVPAIAAGQAALSADATLGGDSTGNLTNGGGATALSLGNTNVDVDFTADFTGNFGAVPADGGTGYSYQVELTLTP